ncbi:MAG TPA: tetratricopeptide repeat protein, partial [Coriobacteriia bacterium]|nr:tetratricopeptide repeat protein [Coriobacteriia bacterium]
GALEEAVAFCPWDRDARYFLVTVYNFGGSNVDPVYHAQALTAVDEALERMPNDTQLHYERAVALRGLGRLDEALVEAQESVRLEPRFAEAAVLLAELLAESGDARGAIEVLEASQEVVLNPALVRDALEALMAPPAGGDS